MRDYSKNHKRFPVPDPEDYSHPESDVRVGP